MAEFKDAPTRSYRLVNAVPVDDHNAALDRAEAAEARVKELETAIERLGELLTDNLLKSEIKRLRDALADLRQRDIERGFLLESERRRLQALLDTAKGETT